MWKTEKRGIWRHGKIKTFLTRGFMRVFFKPLFYTKEDNIHKDFLDTLIPLTKCINHDNVIGRVISQWLILVPKDLFEMVFIEGSKGNVYLQAVKRSNLNNGHLCAYYTQAFALWYFEQFLKNDQEFSQLLGYSILEIETLLKDILGTKNLINDYLNDIRERFDLEKLEVDPRDWLIIYVYEVCDLLIIDEPTKHEVLLEWDANIIHKIEFIEKMTGFIVEQKNISIDMLKS